MASSILLAYATRYGSTKEVTDVVAETLRERGLDVAVEPMRKIRSVSEFGAVLIGAPIYYGTLQKDARHFLAEHREALAKQQVALFVLGPTREPIDESEWQGARDTLAKELAKSPTLNPVAVQVFGGRFDPSSLRLPDSLLRLLPASPIRKTPASDIRDWAAIRRWAGELAGKLQRDQAA